MCKWNYTFDNAPLSDGLKNKMNNAGLLIPAPQTAEAGAEIRFLKDFFTPDGYPRLGEDVRYAEVAYPYLFPVIAPWYDGASVPKEIISMDNMYRQTACEAASMWLNNLLDAAKLCSGKTPRSFHGLAFQEEVNGVPYTFVFPDTRINNSLHGAAAMVLIADSYNNNEDWAKHGGVPLYAREQAMFQLWCWDRFADKATNAPGIIPRTAMIVRICGNLKEDYTIRTVQYNPKEAYALVERICKVKALEPEKGLYWKRRIEDAQSWAEKVENEAFITNDPEIYELAAAYINAQKQHGELKKQIKDLENQRDSIAVKLASRIPAANKQGVLEMSDGTTISVTHQRKRPSSKSVSADIIHAFYPEEAKYILPTQEGTRVTINVL